MGYASVLAFLAAFAFMVSRSSLVVFPLESNGWVKLKLKAVAPFEVEMLQSHVTFLPINGVVSGNPPGYIFRKFGLFKPLSPLSQRFSVRSVVGECGHRLQILPEAKGHRNLFLRWRSWKTSRKLDLSPGMKPCSNIANGTGVESVAGIGCLIHLPDAIDKSLNLRVSDRLTHNSHRHKCQLERHGEECNKPPFRCHDISRGRLPIRYR